MRIRLLLMVGLVLLGLRAEGQAVGTTTVQGTVYLADGTVGSGTLLISWPAFTTATNLAVAAGNTVVQIGADGFVSASLAPNLGAEPAGLYYTAVYHLSDGTVNTEYWVVPAAASASIASVRAQVMPAAVATQSVSKAYVDEAIAYYAAAGTALSGLGTTGTGNAVLAASPTLTGTAVLAAATISGNVSVNATLSHRFANGTGVPTYAAGAGAGTGATLACAASHVCDGVSGALTLTTGTSPATGTVGTLTFPYARANQANCVVSVQLAGSGLVAGVSWSESTTALVLTANGSALAASVAYSVRYWCGGN